MEIFNLKKFESYEGKSWEDLDERLWLKSIFELSRTLHYDYKSKQKSLITQQLLLLTESLIWCLQIASLLWIPSLGIRDWKENNNFWRIVGLIRLDNVCSEYGIINLCIYASLLITLVSIISICTLSILIFYSKLIPPFIVKITQKIFYIFFKVFTIPILTLLTICIKYNWFPKSFVHEYYENNDISNFEVSIPVQILIIAAFNGYCFAYIVIGVICSGEIRHSMARQVIDSKAHSRIDIYLAFSTIIIPILFTLIGNNNTIFFQSILIIIFGALAMEILKEEPYFNFFANCLASIKCLQISLISLFFIFAKIIDATFIILLLFIIILPIIDVVVIYKIKYSKDKVIPKALINLEKVKNAYSLELNLRDFFCSNSTKNKEEILSLLGKCFNETMLYKNKLLIIWEVNYCIFTFGDEALAKIKLCKSRFSDHSIEGDYQEYICQKIVSNFNESESEKFLVYFQKINKTKKQDADLCVKLLDFWKEVVSENPNLKKLNKVMDLVSNSATVITENYSSLHEKFPKSKEALTYYSTFVKDILCEIEKSINLSYKIQSIRDISEISSQSKESSNLSYFDENNGVMLICCEKKNFGEIIFANQKASEILKFPISEIIGNKLSLFISPPYNTYVNQLPLHLQLATEIEIKLPKHFFLFLPNEFLIDCAGKGSLVTMHSHLFFLFTFQKINIPQAFAIISPEWEIYSHSEDFPQYIDTESQDLRGCNIRNLFPSLQSIDIQAFKSFFIPEISKYFIYCFIEFYSLKINYILLINDPIKFQAWQTNKTTENINEMFRNILKNKLNCDFSHRKEENVSTGAFKTDYDEKIEPYHNTQNQSQRYKIDHIVSLSSRSIKIFHIVFILAILIVIFTNTIVLIYTSAAITAESSIELPILLGKIQKSVQALAYFSRGVNALYNLQAPQEMFDFSYYHTVHSVQILEEVKSNLTSDLKSWKHCGGKDIFTEKKIPLWMIDDGLYLENTNLIDALSLFILYGNSFISRWDNTHIAENKELQFFVLNGYVQVFHYCNKTLFDLAECEIHNTKDLELKMNILLSVGFGVLVVCLIITLPFAEYVINRENNLWNQIKKQVYDHYEILKNACIERLSTIHCKTDILFSDSKRKSKSSNFKNRWKYIWRNSLYFALALVFYLVNYFYLYHDCAAFLHLRPSLLRSIINSQVLYKTLLVWTSEALVIKTPVSLIAQSPEAYPFIDAYNKLDIVISSLKFSEKKIRNAEYFPLLSEEFKEKFYKKTESLTEIADYGVYSAGEIIPLDVYYLEYSYRSDWLMMWFKFAQDVIILDLEYDVLVDIANDDSQSVILEQLKWIIIAMAIFVVSSFILYFGCYLFFLAGERKNLEKMKTISRLIPANNILK